MNLKKRGKKKMTLGIVIFLMLLIIAPLVINKYVVSTTSIYIESEENAAQMEADCILVLGAGLKPDGTPNYMLQDRLDKGIQLYNSGVAPKLLLSGDNGQVEYDEVNAMKSYVLERGIPKEDIFLDHAGFSTYESMYRAKAVFEVETAIVVTQQYHLYRALFDANQLGITAYGVDTKSRDYAGQSYREVREILARNKDFILTLLKAEPRYLGDAIPINSNGVLSHD